MRPLVAGLIAALAFGSCKLSLTPESVMKTYDAVKDARKDLTPENEYYVGRAVATNLLSKSDYEYLDAEAFADGRLEGMTAYVNRVGKIIAFAAMETTRDGDRPSPIGGWHFVIIDDASAINAFAAPGGFVFVTRAAVMAAESEDELAAVLAHEVAHVVRGHALGSIKKSRWANVAKTALDASVELDEKALGDLTNVFEGAMDDIVESLLVKGYSRDTEFEADKVGIRILASAGYDPRALVKYLATLERSQETGSGGFSATHPSASDRIKKLQKIAAELPAQPTRAARTERFLAQKEAL
jgi:predicted Zn-dependent protease